MNFFAVEALKEAKPGPRWKALFEKYWPFYERWYLLEGYTARPGYLTCREQLEAHMPELMPVYEKLCELAGGGDLPARFLSLYNPPPYLSGCSQMAVQSGGKALIRNYDYTPKLFDGVFLYSQWLKPVMAMVDCMWGVLDGMNADGLAVSLSFGGKKNNGHGFGIPIILRYVLETCNSVEEALKVLERIPCHMQYNVTLTDRKGDAATAFLSPDKPFEVAEESFATNHQNIVEWPDYAQLTRTEERFNYLQQLALKQVELPQLIDLFLKPPLYKRDFRKGFATLYTSVYRPEEGTVDLIWPHKRLRQQFNAFNDKKVIIHTGAEVMSKVSL